MRTRGCTSAGDGGGSASADPHIRTITTADSIGTADRILWLDTSAGAFTLTLPPAAARAGRPLTFMWAAGSASPTVNAEGGDTILTMADGWTPFLRGESLDVVANDTVWFPY